MASRSPPRSLPLCERVVVSFFSAASCLCVRETGFWPEAPLGFRLPFGKPFGLAFRCSQGREWNRAAHGGESRLGRDRTAHGPESRPVGIEGRASGCSKDKTGTARRAPTSGFLCGFVSLRERRVLCFCLVSATMSRATQRTTSQKWQARPSKRAHPSTGRSTRLTALSITDRLSVTAVRPYRTRIRLRQLIPRSR